MSGPHGRRALLLGLGALLVAFNLRPALTTIGPLLTDIVAQTGIGATGAAWLTTLPVLCLGLGSGLGPWLIRRLGIDRGILTGIATVTAGLALRGLGAVVPLYAGTVLAGLGIGIASVMLPALVKRDFGRMAGRATGLYTMILCIGAALGTGLAVPAQDWLGGGWAPALAVWALPALVAVATWAPFARRRDTVETARRPAGGALFGDPLAWQVTGYLGLQSSLAYIQFGWLPALLAARGLDPRHAGYLAALAALAQAPGALVAASRAGRRRDQRGWIVGVLLTLLAAFLLVAFGPEATLAPACLLLGLCAGASFGIGLTLIVLRAPDARSAASLSAMSQGIGYALASLGPLGFGLAHEASAGWALPAALFAALSLAALACGLGAGQDRHVRSVG